MSYTDPMFAQGTVHEAKTDLETRCFVTRVFLNNVTACFIQKHRLTRKLNGILFVYLI